ncbi:MAG: hypothetical protein A3J46_02225 [Candidatus Yanofskybacteria bacterium RIFCSPHIGHO2_02_FULL_41_11]|uniref:Uncharacterized protein n=1 Tax=Candidatus Yanofskybacteria bacterium RIFCSPHIGHO2_02_FULL_41_11 TaxID=1802675 RepID=A0A1F8FBC5_9BACT|nr:MAG: hypothetical protein A3J46_02225 [Candidatus Yanofskybacteria bacterium RIFCSPHIGHO2_02_FULL_41_11]
MKQRQSLYKFRDWFFNLLIDSLVNSGWKIVVKDFKKFEKRKERKCLGLTDYVNKIIYIDKNRGTPKVLIHEIGHFALGIPLEKMAENLPWKDLKKVKGRHRLDKQFEWDELRTEEFEELFYGSLTKRQIKILQGFIDEARHRNTEETENTE